jgi:ABC-type amino acid transport substrate-binding protein
MVKGAIIVGVDESPPPPLCVGLPGSPDFRGFEVELVEDLARRLGVCLRWRSAYWRVALDALASGELDAICSAATITPDRCAVVDFSAPYLECALTVVTRDVVVADVRALDGLRVGVRVATEAEAFAGGHGQPSAIETFDLNEAAYQALAVGELDAVVDDLAIATYFARRRCGFRVSPPLAGTRGHYGLVMAKDREELCAAVNRGLDALRHDGTLETLRSRWGVEVPHS